MHLKAYDYDFDLDAVAQVIRERGAKVVGLQFPDGLRDKSCEVAEYLEGATGAQVVASADPCYGACDLADDQLERVGADLLVHFGHTEMPHISMLYRIPVYFVPARSQLPMEEVVAKAIALLREKGARRVSVSTTAQHSHKIERVSEALRKADIEPLVAKGDGRVQFVGQVLGCNYTSPLASQAHADAFLFVGTGLFHPLGLALSTEKPVIVADPLLNEARDIADEKERFLRMRWAAVARARDANTFALLVSTKTGQNRYSQALTAKAKIEKHGKKAYLVASRETTPQNLYNWRHVDAYVVTACPRVAIDDYLKFEKPVLTLTELDLALTGQGEYAFDEIRAKEYRPIYVG